MTRLAAISIRLGDSRGTAESPLRSSGMRVCRPKSSLLERIAFEEGSGLLTVSFAGRRIYEYAAVPLALFRELCRAASPGRFYNQRIKGHFACREVSARKRYVPGD